MVGTIASLFAIPAISQAESSTPLPPDVDPSTVDISVTDGTSVRVVNASLSLSTTVDKNLVTAGSRITYTYTAKAVGGSFGNIRLEDDKCSPISAPAGDTNADAVLSPDENWVFTCKTTVAKDVTNAAKLTGRYIDTAAPVPSGSPTPSTPPSTGTLKDGTYLGAAATVVVSGESISYPIAVQAVISGGRITSITVPTFGGTDPTSRNIGRFQVATNAALNNDPSNPTMIFEAMQAQSANIATVSGATYTTAGFKNSLADALAKAAA
jgi:uncharacterized protein with FMN-binding domain